MCPHIRKENLSQKLPFREPFKERISWNIFPATSFFWNPASEVIDL